MHSICCFKKTQKKTKRIKSQKFALLSATHEIFLYVYLQNNRSGVDFLLQPQIDFECEIGLFAGVRNSEFANRVLFVNFD